MQCVLNEDHLSAAVSEVLRVCRHRLVIATANVKNLYVPDKARGIAGKGARSILDVFEEMSE